MSPVKIVGAAIILLFLSSVFAASASPDGFLGVRWVTPPVIYGFDPDGNVTATTTLQPTTTTVTQTQTIANTTFTATTTTSLTVLTSLSTTVYTTTYTTTSGSETVTVTSTVTSTQTVTSTATATNQTWTLRSEALPPSGFEHNLQYWNEPLSSFRSLIAAPDDGKFTRGLTAGYVITTKRPRTSYLTIHYQLPGGVSPEDVVSIRVQMKGSVSGTKYTIYGERPCGTWFKLKVRDILVSTEPVVDVNLTVEDFNMTYLFPDNRLTVTLSWAPTVNYWALAKLNLDYLQVTVTYRYAPTGAPTGELLLVLNPTTGLAVSEWWIPLLILGGALTVIGGRGGKRRKSLTRTLKKYW